jgi:hypothetical protein
MELPRTHAPFRNRKSFATTFTTFPATAVQSFRKGACVRYSADILTRIVVCGGLMDML